MSEEKAKRASEKPQEPKPLDAVRRELVKTGAMVIKGKS